MPIRSLLADDHVMLRQGLRALLEQAVMVVIGEASDGQEALRLAHAQPPDVAVLDIGMPHLNGIETARRLRGVLPQTKIVLLTMHTDDPYVLEAMQAGAVGYVLKTQAALDIVQAIRDVVQGGIYLSPRVSRAVVQAYLTRSDLPPDPLTSREREILQLIAEGQTTKEIAWSLDLSVKTVESHRINLMRKLDIHETATLVRYAIRRGLTIP
jgi:two-component system, NarL family, response regulator NreC